MCLKFILVYDFLFFLWKPWGLCRLIESLCNVNTESSLPLLTELLQSPYDQPNYDVRWPSALYEFEMLAQQSQGGRVIIMWML